MNSVFERARAANVHVSLVNANAVDLDEGKATVKILMKAVKAWKRKAEESAMPTRQVRAEKEKEAEAGTSKAVEKGRGKATEVEKDAPPVVADAGRPVSLFCLFIFTCADLSFLAPWWAYYHPACDDPSGGPMCAMRLHQFPVCP